MAKKQKRKLIPRRESNLNSLSSHLIGAGLDTSLAVGASSSGSGGVSLPKQVATLAPLFETGPVLLLRAQDAACRSVFSSDKKQAAFGKDVASCIAVYTADLPEKYRDLLSSEDVVSHIRESLPSVMGAYFGEKAGVTDDFQKGWEYRKYLDGLDRGEGVPDRISQALGILVPGMVSGAMLEVDQAPGGISPSDFSKRLFFRSKVFGENCLSCSLRATQEGNSRDLVDLKRLPKRLLSLLKNPAARRDLVGSVISGDVSSLRGVGMYRMARGVGLIRHTDEVGRLGFDKTLGGSKVISTADIEDGLEEFGRIELPEGVHLYDPVRIHGPFLRTASSGKVSNFQMMFGLRRDTVSKIARALTGDAGVRLHGNDPFSWEIFNEHMVTALQEEKPLDSGEESPFQYLVDHLAFPEDFTSGGKGMTKDASGYSILAGEFGDQDWLTGSGMFDQLFGEIDASFPLLGKELLDHQQGMRDGNSIYANTLSLCEEREHFLRNMGMDRSTEIFRLPCIPAVPVASAKSMQGEEGTKDPTHMLLMAMGNTVENLFTDHSDIQVLRLQALMGYYYMGGDAYSELPFSRTDKAHGGSRPWAARTFKGIVGALQSKGGLLAEHFNTSRFQATCRMKASPELEISVDEASVPAFNYAVIRGVHVAAGIRTYESFNIDDIGVELHARLLESFGRTYMDSNMAEELRRIIADMNSEVSDRFGDEGSDKMKAEIESILDSLPLGRKDEFARIALGRESESSGLNVDGMLRSLSLHLLSSDISKNVVDSLNEQWPVLVSRYPRLHHHSFVSLRPVISEDPDSQTLSPNHLVAHQLCLDYDGDQIEMISLIPFNVTVESHLEAAREMLDTHRPSVALYDSGSGTESTLFIDLNAVEGLVKIGNVYNQGPVEGSRDSYDVRKALDAVLPSKEDLIARSSDSTYWHSLFREFRKEVREPGVPFEADQVVQFEEGQSTMAREFYWALTNRLTGLAEPAFGPRYVPEGSMVDTNVDFWEKSLVAGASAQMATAAEVGKVVYDSHPITNLLQNAQYFSGKMSEYLGHSMSSKGKTLEQQFKDAFEHPVIVRVREEFQKRDDTLQGAKREGIISNEGLKSGLILAEQGSGFDNLKFNELRVQYLKGDAQFEDVSEFLESQLSDGSIGIKSVLKASCQLVADEYWKKHGVPHVLQEQVLSAKIKAKPEILQHMFTGSVNVIDNKVSITAVGGLVPGQTVQGLLAGCLKAIDNSVSAKTGIQQPGEAAKDYQTSCGSIEVTCQEPESFEDLHYAIGEYLGTALSEGNGHLLVQQLMLRPVKVEGVEDADVWSKRLTKLSLSHPSDRKGLLSALNELYAASPEASLSVPTPLFEKGTGCGVSARSLGCNPMRGFVKEEDGSLRRALFTEMPSVGYPVGAVVGGAIGEDASQAQLKLRYTTGATGESFESLSDFWRVKYGPFPQHSAFGRVGAEKTLSINPQQVGGSFPTYATVFKAEGNFGENIPETVAREVKDFGGVQVFPGECYQVKDGVLQVGTNRPESLGFAVALDTPDAASLEAVVPESFVLNLPNGHALAGSMDELVPGCVPVTRKYFTQYKISSSDVETLLNASNDVSNFLKPVKGSAVRDIDPESPLFKRVGFLRVPEGLFLDLDTVLPGGSLVDPRTGVAEVNQDQSMASARKGFFNYLDYLKGRAPHKQKAVLSPVSGEVTSVSLHSGRPIEGEVVKYQVSLKTNSGESKTLNVPCIHPFRPVVQKGQKLDVCDPVNQGYVDLKDRSKLLGAKEANIQFSRFVQGYFYDVGQPGQLPVNLEVLTKSCFDSMGNFKYLREAHRGLEDSLNLDFQSSLIRGELESSMMLVSVGGLGNSIGKVKYDLPLNKDGLADMDKLHPRYKFAGVNKSDMGPDAEKVKDHLRSLRIAL